MKARHAFLLFLSGLCLDVIGTLLKISYRPGPDVLLVTGATLKIEDTLVLLGKLLAHFTVRRMLHW